MPDWNNDGRTDGLDAFISAKTYAESEKACHCEEGAARRGNPFPFHEVLDTILTALFWLAMFILAVLFF